MQFVVKESVIWLLHVGEQLPPVNQISRSGAALLPSGEAFGVSRQAVLQVNGQDAHDLDEAAFADGQAIAGGLAFRYHLGAGGLGGRPGHHPPRPPPPAGADPGALDRGAARPPGGLARAARRAP